MTLRDGRELRRDTGHQLARREPQAGSDVAGERRGGRARGIDRAARRDDRDARRAHATGAGSAAGSRAGHGLVAALRRAVTRRLGRPVRRGGGWHEPVHPVDQPPDPQPLERPERVAAASAAARPPTRGDTASAPAQKYSRQSSKSRIPPLAMIGSRMPGVAQLRDDPQADRLDRPPRDRPVPVLEVRLAGLGVEAQALDGVDRRDRRAAVLRRQPRLPAVVLVRADLEDDRVAALRDGSAGGLLEDRLEREVDVVAARR